MKLSNFWMKKCPLLKRCMGSWFAITQHVAMLVVNMIQYYFFLQNFLDNILFPSKEKPVCS